MMTLINLMNCSKVLCYPFLMICAKRCLEKKARSNPDRFLTIHRRHKNLVTKVSRATREQYYRTLLETSIGNGKTELEYQLYSL